MSTKSKEYRESKEMENLFKDPRYIREVWRNVGNAILRNPAQKPCTKLDKNGDETLESAIQGYTYASLKRDLTQLGETDREPTELEMILACQAVRARYDTSAAVFIRDTLGAKPVDESKVEQTVNAFESLTDEELELLAAHRAQTASATPSADQTIIVDAEEHRDSTTDTATNILEDTHGNT